RAVPLIAALAAAQKVHAVVDYTYAGGEGGWSTSVANWYTLGSASVAWPQGNHAHFESDGLLNGATITVQSDIVADSISFDAAFSLTGGPITLSGGTISVSDDVSVTMCGIGGNSGLYLRNGGEGSSPGRLTFGGANTYTGTTTIDNIVLTGVISSTSGVV